MNFQEAERVSKAWQAITAEAEKINDRLPPEYRDAFFELVLYPTKASATVAENSMPSLASGLGILRSR